MGNAGGAGNRVYQLADELGVPVKEIVARLNEQGVIVRSTSAAVPKRVARWLRDCYRRRGEGNRTSAPTAAKPPSPVKSTKAPRRGQRGRSTTSWNTHRLGIPVVSRDQATRSEPRKRAADPEKVRKRVNELLGTNDGPPRKPRPPRAADNGVKPKKRKKRTPTDAGPKTSICPNCVQRVDVDRTRAVLVAHQNSKGQQCRGSGHQLPQRSTDALDHRVSGSFEGGRR